MKLQLISDLHLEFGFLPKITNAGADVLLLSGDIIVASRLLATKSSPYYGIAQDWLKWFEKTCARFPQVIYIAGNHEHYSGRFDATITILRNNLEYIKNLQILDNDAFTIGDTTFLGTTLWTDFDRNMFAAKLAVQNGLNDYHVIKRGPTQGYRKLKPEDTLLYHREALNFINDGCNVFDKIVVVGHHAPSMRSIEDQYRSSGLLNYGYASDIEQFIFDHPKIKLWTHGHVHSSHDYYIGETRVVANPRGYTHISKSGFPENLDFNPNLILNI